MLEAKPKLLIVEGDLDVAEMLNAYFRVQDYEVVTVYLGRDGIKACQTFQPDLIILNIHLPDIDSNKIVRRIHGNHRTAHTPFIILTDKSEPPDVKEGLESAVVDYIYKPFDVQELRLHVRNALRRATQDSLTNPVTGLPEGLLVDEHLNDCLEASTWTLLIASLENLDNFREVYGFVASDDVLRAVSIMIQNAVNELGDKNDFLGHLSPTDFILVTARATITQLQERIRNRVTQSLGYFYPIKDREKAAGLGKRITFKVGILQSEEGFFSSLDAVKTSLQLKKHEDYPCK